MKNARTDKWFPLPLRSERGVPLVVVGALTAALFGCPSPISTGPDCEANPDAELCAGEEEEVSELGARLFVDPPFGTGFECVAIGCEEQRTFVLENRGGRDVRLTLVRTSVETSSEFNVSLHPMQDNFLDEERTLAFPTVEKPLVMKAGATIGVVVSYAPADADADEGILHIDWYDSATEYVDAVVEKVQLPLSTRVLGGPEAELVTSALNFGFVEPGVTKTLTVDITNVTDGNAMLEVSPPVFASGSATTFRVEMDTSVFVASGETVSVPVLYTPSQVQASFGALYFATNDGARPQLAVQLKGTAIQSPWYELVTPAEFMADFGNIRIGDEREREVTVRNLGGLPLFVTPSLSMGDPLVYTTNVSLDVPLPAINPLEERTFAVRARPSSGGDAIGRLAFTTNDPTLPSDWIDLQSYGIAPDAAFSSADLQFGNIVQSWIAPAQTVQVWNQGTGELTISGIEWELGSSSQVKLATTPQLPQKLAQGDVLELSVFVEGQTLGPANATLLIHTDSIVEPTRSITVSANVVACDVGCAMANGTPSCLSGSCAVGTCFTGFHNADQSFGNGCECAVDVGGDVGGACFSGVNVGPLGDDGQNDYQKSTSRVGTLHSLDDVDLYYFYGVDGGGFDDLFSDSFGIKVTLTGPPGLEFCRRTGPEGCGGENQRVCGYTSSWSQDGSWGSDDNTWATIWVRWNPTANPMCGAYSISFRADDG